MNSCVEAKNSSIFDECFIGDFKNPEKCLICNFGYVNNKNG